MDERLERALEFANYRITLSNQKRNIRTRMQILLECRKRETGLYDLKSMCVHTFVCLCA